MSALPLLPKMMLEVLVVAAGRGPAEGVDPHAVGELVDDRMMVEHVAVDRLESSRTARPGRGTSRGPGCASPNWPGRGCARATGGRRRPRASGNGTACCTATGARTSPGLRSMMTYGARRKFSSMDDDVADGAVVDSLHGLGVARVVAALQAGDEAQALLSWPGRRPSASSSSRPGRCRGASRRTRACRPGSRPWHGAGGTWPRWQSPPRPTPRSRACSRRSRQSSGRRPRRPGRPFCSLRSSPHRS